MMITGSISAQAASLTALNTSAQRLARRSHHRFLARQVPPGDPERRRQHEGREDAGEEQLGDRDVGGDAEDDETDARRHDRRDDSRRRDQAGRPTLVVAGRDHHRQQHRRQRSGVGDRRARQRREQAGGDDGHVAEAAADVADQHQRHVDDALRQAADVHQLAGEQEERHRQQRIAVGAMDHVLRQDLGVEHAQIHHQRRAAHQQSERDRDAERHRRQQRTDEDEDRHAWSSVSLTMIRSASVARPVSSLNRSFRRMIAADTPKTRPTE